MKGPARYLLWLLLAAAAGWAASELLARASWSRDVIGVILGRGKFVATVRGQAIHQRDFTGNGSAVADTLLMAETLRRTAGKVETSEAEVEQELDRLRWQFNDAEGFSAALAGSGVTEAWLRMFLADHLAVRRELEIRLAPQLSVTEEESRKAFGEAPERFALPRRFRASHIFVAAPDGSPEDIMQSQRSLAQGLSIQLLAEGEFADLAAEGSEDEETKLNGGELNYFADRRALPEFVQALEKLTVDQISPPTRSRLGFHIIRLAEMLPERGLSLEEARGEIALDLANRKRSAAIERMRAALRAGRPAFPSAAQR